MRLKKRLIKLLDKILAQVFILFQKRDSCLERKNPKILKPGFGLCLAKEDNFSKNLLNGMKKSQSQNLLVNKELTLNKGFMTISTSYFNSYSSCLILVSDANGR